MLGCYRLFRDSSADCTIRARGSRLAHTSSYLTALGVALMRLANDDAVYYLGLLGGVL